MRSKAQLRRELGQQSVSMELTDHGRFMTDKMSELVDGGTWASFQSLPGEPDPSVVTVHFDQVKWVYPRVEGEHLRFYFTRNEDDFEVHPNWGMREPIVSRCTEAQAEQIDGFLVPGVAFDRKCQRLGRGKGFYDRALRGSPAAIKVGFTHSSRLLNEELPVEDHDIRMDYVLTETELIAAGKEQE